MWIGYTVLFIGNLLIITKINLCICQIRKDQTIYYVASSGGEAPLAMCVVAAFSTFSYVCGEVVVVNEYFYTKLNIMQIILRIDCTGSALCDETVLRWA